MQGMLHTHTYTHTHTQAHTHAHRHTHTHTHTHVRSCCAVRSPKKATRSLYELSTWHLPASSHRPPLQNVPADATSTEDVGATAGPSSPLTTKS